MCVTGKTGHILLVTQELAAKSIAPKYQKGGRKCPSRRREFCRVLLLEETGGGVEGRVRGRDFGLSEVRGAPRAMVCVRRFWPRRDDAADQLTVSPTTAEKEARRSEEPMWTLRVRIHKMYRHRDDLTRLDQWFVGGLFFLKSWLIKVVLFSESVSAAVPLTRVETTGGCEC